MNIWSYGASFGVSLGSGCWLDSKIFVQSYSYMVLNTDYCISTTGNAGPSTNDDFSKVGQIFISIATPQKIITEELSLTGSREEIIEIVVEKTHKLLLKNLIE